MNILRRAIKNHPIVMFLSLALLIIVVLFGILDNRQVTLDVAHVETTHLPNYIGIYSPEKTDWVVRKTDINNEISRTILAPPEGSVTYDPFITITTTTYLNGLQSQVKFYEQETRVDLSAKWPNYYHPEVRFVKDPSPFNVLDNNYVVCEMGNEEGCQLWYYLGRYGRTQISITYTGIQEPRINKETFAQIVKVLVDQLRQ